MASVKPKDKLFGAKVLELGYLSEADLTLAYQELADAHQSSVGLRDLLEQKGTLTKEKSRAVERALSGGQQIAGYELLEKVGQGGMGAVFRARQISMDRIVALKILPPKLAKDKKFCERFIMEARASGGLNHINIIQGIDVGESQGHYYFAMEYVDGCTAKDLLDEQGRLPESMALLICRQMADALDHANQNKLVHRDIKPDNIMLAGLPENWKELSDQNKLTFIAKLCDLGLARSVEGGTDEMKGVAVGTPHFIAPEQARGETDVDTRADIYSLGASLYNMLTAKTLFSAKSSRDVMMMHLTDQAPDPNEIEGVNVSENTLRIMEKMLAKDRNDRYESPKQLLEDLNLVIGGKKPVYTKGFNAKSSLALPAKLRKGESTGSVRALRSGRTTVSGRHASVRTGVATEKADMAPGSKLPLIGGIGAVVVLGLVGVYFATRPADEGVQPPRNSGTHGGNPTVYASVPVGPTTPPNGGTPADPADDVHPAGPKETPKEENERVARETFKTTMEALAEDAGKNVALLRENNSKVRAVPDLAKQFDERLAQELEKWRVALTSEWAGIDSKLDQQIKDLKFATARKTLTSADPKFQEIQKTLADSGKKIDDKEKAAVDARIQEAGKLAEAKKFTEALALVDPAGKTEFSDAGQQRFAGEQTKLDAAYRQFQVLDAALNIDQHEKLFEQIWLSLTPVLNDGKNPNRLADLGKALKTEASKKDNLMVLGWLNRDRLDADQARVLVKAAEDFLAKNPKTPVFRIGEDGKPVAAAVKSAKDGKIAFQDVSGEFPLEAALGSFQVARLGGALDKDASHGKVLGAAMLAMLLSEFDKAEVLLHRLPVQVADEASRRLAVLMKQPDDEKLVRRGLDTVTLLLQAGKPDDAAKKFDELDTAQTASPAGLKYALRFLELRGALKNKGFPQAKTAEAAAAPAAESAPPPPPPAAPVATTPATPPTPAPGTASTAKRGVNVDYYENVQGLPKLPDFRQVKPSGTVQVPNIDFVGKVGDKTIGDNMVLRIRGTIDSAGGRYQFRLQCDDGGRLTIWEQGHFDHRIQTEDWTTHPMHATNAEAIDLPAGTHRFSIDYFNGGGGSGLRLEWIPPGQKDWQTVPATVLGH